eukprot:scaffold2003_cov139-Cylindrotheca_fusiformis.AAC.13
MQIRRLSRYGGCPEQDCLAQWNRDGIFPHTVEGNDDMPGHVKSSLIGPSLMIPIRIVRLAVGTLQGIYLNVHCDQGGFSGGTLGVSS